jgi:membrane protease YdiL (CAAX protease family)
MSEYIVIGVGLFIAFLGVDAIKNPVDRFDVPVLSQDQFGKDVTKWIVAGVLVTYVLIVEGRGPADIGITSIGPLALLGWGVGGFIVTYLAGGVAMAAPDSVLKKPTEAVSDMTDRSVPEWLFIAVTAGVTESILFQGYPIERLADPLGIPAAGAIAFVAFTGAHWLGDTYSIREVLFIAVPALCMTVLYVLTRNLFVVIIAHTLVDVVSLAAVHVAGAQPETNTETLSDSP